MGGRDVDGYRADSSPAGNVDMESWRSEFPILERFAYLANCSQGPCSKRAQEAVQSFLTDWRENGMSWENWLQAVEECRKEFAGLIGTEPSEIAVSTSVSEAVSSIASALDPRGKRNKVIVTEAEFPTVAYVWLAQRRRGLNVQFVPVCEGEIPIECYVNAIDETTLLVSATHVYFKNGYKQDVGEIAKIAHEKGALLLLDCYQSIGTTPIDVMEIDADFLVAGNLKFLLGTAGIAFMYVRRELADKLQPTLTGWFGQREPFGFDPRRFEYAPGARRFDTGTPPIIAAFAALAGMSIIRDVGVDNIRRKIDDLSQHAISSALDKGLELASPRDVRRKGATTAIRVADAPSVERELRDRGVIASARGDVIRLAPHFFTVPDEIELALRHLRELA